MDKLLQHYEQELGRLRHATRKYADAHPTTAAALEFGPDASTDPEVERLLQSVALLNASMQKSIEENQREFHRALLQTLQPQCLRPLPACGIAQVDTSSSRRNEVSTASILPRGSLLRYGEHQYTTIYDACISPFAIKCAKFQPTINLPATLSLPSDSTSTLVITIDSISSSITFDKPSPAKLRIFIDGEPEMRAALLDAILMRSLCVCLEVDATWRLLPESPFAPVGFQEQESLLPCQAGAQSPRLLGELFRFPEKFSFIDLDLAAIAGLCPSSCSRITLHVVLPASSPKMHRASANNFQLACTPVINLFPQTANTIRLDGRSEAYPIKTTQAGSEIYSIDGMAAANMSSNNTLLPFHGTNHFEPGTFWQLEMQEGFAVKFVDRDQRAIKLDTGTVVAHLTCTNGEPPRQQSNLISEVSIGGHPMHFLHGPASSASLLDQEPLCEALYSEDLSLPALSKLLRLHGCNFTESLKSLITNPSTAWLQHPMGPVHMYGTEFTLILDEAALRAHSIHTLAELLARTLADKLRENRFAQLSIANEDGQILHEVHPLVGTRKLV